MSFEMNIKNWETDRLEIERTEEEDLNELSPLLLNYETSKFVSKYPKQFRSVEDAKNFIFYNLYSGLISFTIRIKGDRTVIGQFGFSIFEDLIYLFYWLGLNFQGKGYASESLIELSNKIFKKSKQQTKFIISLHKDNLKSRKLADKIVKFMLNDNPGWTLFERDDGMEEYEVFSIDENFVHLKNDSDEYRIVYKSTFPDEFLEIGKKETLNLLSLIVTK